MNPFTAAFSSGEDSAVDISSNSEDAEEPYNVLVGTFIGKCGHMNLHSDTYITSKIRIHVITMYSKIFFQIHMTYVS